MGGSATANAQVGQGGTAQASAKSHGGSGAGVMNKIAVATALAGKGGRTRADAMSDNVEVLGEKEDSVEDI